MGFGERPAILVVDLVKAFTDPKRMLGADLDSQITATQSLLEMAHDRGIPVIFSTVRYDDVDLRDAGIWALKQKGSVTLRAETDGHELDPRLTFAKGDSLLLKKYASCFFGTDLVSRLQQPPHRYPDHCGLHDQRLRARDRRRCDSERVPANCRTRSRRRSFGRRSRTKPV